MQIFTHRDRHAGVCFGGHAIFKGVWMSLNSYKEYLFGFETLVFAI